MRSIFSIGLLLKPIIMHGNSMNVSVKNNLKLLKKRNKFSLRLVSNTKIIGKTEYNLPKASSKQLRDIRKRLQSERQIWWIKTITLTSFAFFGAVALVMYLIGNII